MADKECIRDEALKRFPERKALFKEEWVKLGYTSSQQKQLNFLSNMEPYESLTSLPTYWVECKTCKGSKEFHSVEGARSFIMNHKGHNTWLQYGGKTKI